MQKYHVRILLKKSILTGVIVSLLILGCVLVYWQDMPKIDSVFDQIYYEVRTVKRGGDSVLISGTNSAYADYDFGQFENIQIPDLDMCLWIEGDTLHFLFFRSDVNLRDTVRCRYERNEKRLYAECSLDALVDIFLNDYFEWWSRAGKTNPYSQDHLGEYDFKFQETVY